MMNARKLTAFRSRTLLSSSFLVNKRMESQFVGVGSIRREIRQGSDPSRVPRGYLPPVGIDISSQDLQHLQWMLKKDKLAQDMFLVGPPSPYRRWLAMKYCELTEQELEFVQLCRDTTESDLKQRREINGGDVVFVDQAPVRAAREGRCLVLDGVEKIERNVLPTINNLLENREMHLDSGEFMISADRYDALANAGEDMSGLVRVHEDFRVVALGLPVPPFPGNTLDPPLRSRFQSRIVLAPAASNLLQEVMLAAPGLPLPLAKKLVTLVEGLQALSSNQKAEGNMGPTMPVFPVNAARTVALILEKFPNEDLARVMARSYPAMSRVPIPGIDARVVSIVQRALKTFGVESSAVESTKNSIVELSAIGNKTFNPDKGTVTVVTSSAEDDVVEARAGSAFKSMGVSSKNEKLEKSGESNDTVVELPMHSEAMFSMFQDHSAGADLLLLGEKGSGKSVLARHFARQLGYVPVLFSLFKDQTARDLLQRRATDEKGNTFWEPSPVVTAAIEGHAVILDGLDRLSGDTLSILQRLIVDREIELYDGTRLVRSLDSSDGNEKLGLKSRDSKVPNSRNQVYQVHPSFRIIALACPPSEVNPWLTDEVLTWFRMTMLPTLDNQQKKDLIGLLCPRAPTDMVAKLMHFSESLRGDVGAELNLSDENGSKTSTIPSSMSGFYINRKSSQNSAKAVAASQRRHQKSGLAELSLRQILRLCRKMHAFPNKAEELLGQNLKSMLMLPYLPKAKRDAIMDAMMEAGIEIFENGSTQEEKPRVVKTSNVNGSTVCIGDVSLPVNMNPAKPEMIPDPLFFDIPSHTLALQGMMQDLYAGEKHLLLLGPQGCGKNKLADRLCHLLQREREYVQLHRDSTVGTLTLAPSLRDGQLVWDDSPLVRAVMNGHILIVDEADKAPVEVTSVLKSLIEDREMLLADGRRIVDKVAADEYRDVSGFNTEDLIEIHDDFSMIVLANRPGFPFLGNHFFRDIGDLFAPHTIDNPDEASEAELLRSYGPSVREEIIASLAAAFADLRREVVVGKITYPFSTREAVAVVRHMEEFAEDGVSAALEDVLGFDAFDPVLRRQLCKIFERHSIPISEDPLGKGEPKRLSVEIAQDINIPGAKKTGTLKVSDLS